LERSLGFREARVGVPDKLQALFPSDSPAWIPGNARTKYACNVRRLITADGIEGWTAIPIAGRERAGIGGTLADLLLSKDTTDIDRF
jgi:hypothetical protein